MTQANAQKFNSKDQKRKGASEHYGSDILNYVAEIIETFLIE